MISHTPLAETIRFPNTSRLEARVSLLVPDLSRQIAGHKNAQELDDTNGHSGRAQADGVRLNEAAKRAHAAHLEQSLRLVVALECAQLAGNVGTTADGYRVVRVREPVLVRVQAAACKLFSRVFVSQQKN